MNSEIILMFGHAVTTMVIKVNCDPAILYCDRILAIYGRKLEGMVSIKPVLGTGNLHRFAYARTQS